MKKKNTNNIADHNKLYNRIRQILESAKSNVARSVNTTQVIAYWLIGCEIVEEEQQGKSRAAYGKRFLEGLAERLNKEYGPGYSVQNLRYMRQFYLQYHDFIQDCQIRHTVCGELPKQIKSKTKQKHHTACGELTNFNHKVWQPGKINPNLSWSIYRHLLKIDTIEKRSFYEIEAAQNKWVARELERQINSLLYERLAKSKDKKGLMRLATKGQEILKPDDVFKDPVVIEFLGLPESHRLVETKLEEALISNLQAFLLELGKGFAFVSRQERLTLDGDHFYVDLVFYHTILKCYVLIDLKTGKLTHQDLGQLQLYVNYYDQERRSPDDNPTLGLILCTDKNDAVVKYTLGQDQKKQIFTSRYKLHLPSEAELKAEIKRELKTLDAYHHTKTPKKSQRKKKR
jgi:predicted nuclease of restriction endonuclease-like (RecB) superfamily